MNPISLKKAVIPFIIGMIAIITGFLTSCVKQKFDLPPIYIPSVNFPSNAKIDTLLKLYGTHTDTVQITQDIVIKGIVTGNDKSGNIYKKIYIEDNTGGLDVEIDAYDLYTSFNVGQRVFIKCQGLYLGQYGSAMELGYLYQGGIGRIPATMMSTHIYPDSLPGKEPVPATIDLATFNPDNYINRLVAIPSVRFPDAGLPFVTGGVTTSRNIGDAAGNPIILNSNNFILYTSNYANFSASLLPAGIGTLQGIFTVYNGKYEMLVRDLKDLVNFVDTGQTIIYHNNFSVLPADWVIYTVSSNKPWTCDGAHNQMVANGYGGNVACETWLITPAIDLTNITNPILNFYTWTDYNDNGLLNPLEVKISTDYSGSGNPVGASWSNLQCTLPAQNSAVLTNSGDVSLSAYHQPVYIAYRYLSSGVGASTSTKWELSAFKVTGRK